MDLSDYEKRLNRMQEAYKAVEVLDAMHISFILERKMEWDKWREEIPCLRFPAHWEVRIVPPFAGAVVRFLVKKNEKERISVYLDCYSHLGCYEELDSIIPYWEIYPYKENTFRCAMQETDKLLAAIQEALDEPIVEELKEAAQDEERNAEIAEWDQFLGDGLDE